MRGIFVLYAEVQPIFAVINCKDNDYWGIIVIFCTNCLLFKRKTVSLQRNTDDVLPVKVCLTALNWECEWESPTVPQQWTPLWLLDNKAIARLGEKASGSGGKSEDQPFSVKKAATPRCMVLSGAIRSLWNKGPEGLSCTVVLSLGQRYSAHTCIII